MKLIFAPLLMLGLAGGAMMLPRHDGAGSAGAAAGWLAPDCASPRYAWVPACRKAQEGGPDKVAALEASAPSDAGRRRGPAKDAVAAAGPESSATNTSPEQVVERVAGPANPPRRDVAVVMPAPAQAQPAAKAPLAAKAQPAVEAPKTGGDPVASRSPAGERPEPNLRDDARTRAANAAAVEGRDETAPAEAKRPAKARVVQAAAPPQRTRPGRPRAEPTVATETAAVPRPAQRRVRLARGPARPDAGRQETARRDTARQDAGLRVMRMVTYEGPDGRRFSVIRPRGDAGRNVVAYRDFAPPPPAVMMYAPMGYRPF